MWSRLPIQDDLGLVCAWALLEPHATLSREAGGLLPGQYNRAPKDHKNIRILPNMVSGIPLILVLGTRMYDPYVYVVVGAPIQVWKTITFWAHALAETLCTFGY